MNGPRAFPHSKRWALLLVLSGCLLGSVASQVLPARPAWAQVPDSGAQRNQMVTELQAINSKLSDIEALLKSGKVTVTIQEQDTEPGSKRAR